MERKKIVTFDLFVFLVSFKIGIFLFVGMWKNVFCKTIEIKIN